MKKTTQQASLKISQEVIETIARVAALEIKGVSSDVIPESSIKNIFSSNNMIRKSVEVRIVDGTAEISISLNLEFGAVIAETCLAVQKNIKENVQTMTGIMVSKVNVFVEGVSLPQNGEKKDFEVTTEKDSD